MILWAAQTDVSESMIDIDGAHHLLRETHVIQKLLGARADTCDERRLAGEAVILRSLESLINRSVCSMDESVVEIDQQDQFPLEQRSINVVLEQN